MQTTISRKLAWFRFGQVKIAALVLGIVASTIVGTLVYTSTRTSEQAPAVSASRANVTDVYAQMRLLEFNTLPEAAATATVNYRLLDMNVLPGDDRTQVTNHVTSADEYRFIELNTWPGDSAPQLPDGEHGENY